MTEKITRALLVGGALAGPLFIAVVAIQAFTRAGFDLGRHPPSLLSLGDLGWIQITNFVVSGLLALGLAVGIRRVLGPRRGGTGAPVLAGVYGVGLIVAGVFRPDAAYGFPPGSPEGTPETLSVNAVLHGVGFVLAFGALTLACLVFARRDAALGGRGWATYSVVTAVAALGLSMWPSQDGASVRYFIAAVLAWTWTSATALRLRTELADAPQRVDACDEFRQVERSSLPSTKSQEESVMQTVSSTDGSRIAYDRYGSGPAVILVAGALGYRKFKKMEELAQLLAERCTVINYDRRGRGDSTEVKPFALEREIEDIAALIEAEGGSASLWGWSSGGALALHAAAAGIGVERLSVYEVPFIVTSEARPTRDYGERLDRLVAAGDRSGAVRHFMRNAMGIPAPFVALMRLAPMWKGLKATAHTLPCDWAALGKHRMYGAPLDPEEFASVTMPTLVVHGGKSPTLLREGSRALANVLPNAELRELAGVSHNLKMDVLAPVLAEFFAGEGHAVLPDKAEPAAATP